MRKFQIKLRHLYFTGPGLDPAGLEFVEGLNIIWGASNTGKSFAVKALDFMLGKKKLPDIKERKKYDSIWLGLFVPGLGNKTIYRAAAGGRCLLFDGLIYCKPDSESGQLIDIDTLVLNSVGLGNKQVVKDQNGQKQSLTLRTMIHHILVDESSIMDEGSPVHRGQYQDRTAEKNILRLLLTGTDDSAIVSYETTKTRNLRLGAKRELIDEFLSEIEARLGDHKWEQAKIREHLHEVEGSTSQAQDRLKKIQIEIDELTERRRQLFESRAGEAARARELDLTIRRFKWLAQSYRSDLERLEALMEAAELIGARTGRPCSLCGAASEHQAQPIIAADLNRSRTAAEVELRRIQRDQRDLTSTIRLLDNDKDNVHKLIEDLTEELAALEKKTNELRPIESHFRADFEAKWAIRTELIEVQRLIAERESLLARKANAGVAHTERQQNTKLLVGIDGPTGDAFAKTVEEVLQAWHFLDKPHVSFNDEAQDIRVNGNDRQDDGKGVRAILHAAFKVALVIYCHRQGLPHLGFLILDSPLVAYRDPLTSRHGALTIDEIALSASKVADHFYNHLSSLRDIVQILVLENTDPPLKSSTTTRIHVFEGRGGLTREGFFPRTI